MQKKNSLIPGQLWKFLTGEILLVLSEEEVMLIHNPRINTKYKVGEITKKNFWSIQDNPRWSLLK